MTAEALLAALRAAGFAVAAAAGRLTVGPKAKLTDDWRQAIREHRDDLLALVREEAAAEAVRPFLDPPPDDPAWVPAAEYRAFWACLETFNDKPVRPTVQRGPAPGSATAAGAGKSGGKRLSVPTPNKKRGAAS